MTEQQLPTRPATSVAQLRRMVAMLIPGGLGIIATVGLATGKIGDLPTQDANRFLIFLQVELLALGVGRLGYDQLVLGRASGLRDPDHLGVLRLLVRLVLPVALVAALVAGLTMRDGRWVGLLLAVPADVVSTVTGSFELARRKYLTNIAFSWMNYPVFLVFLVMPGIGIDSSRLENVVALFCATSVARAVVAVTVLAAHRRRRASLDAAHHVELTARELGGAATVGVSQIVIQRGDGAALALFEQRFPTAAVTSYLLASRLLDASYTISAVAASLARVDRPARGAEPSSGRHGRPRALLAAGWVAMWALAGLALLAIQRPHPLAGWGRVLLAVPAASAYIGIFMFVLRELGAGRSVALARRFVGYIGIAAAMIVLSLMTREPGFMLLTATIVGTLSLIALTKNPD